MAAPTTQPAQESGVTPPKIPLHPNKEGRRSGRTSRNRPHQTRRRWVYRSGAGSAARAHDPHRRASPRVSNQCVTGSRHAATTRHERGHARFVRRDAIRSYGYAELLLLRVSYEQEDIGLDNGRLADARAVRLAGVHGQQRTKATRNHGPHLQPRRSSVSGSTS
jgi:hypothetical protein